MLTSGFHPQSNGLCDPIARTGRGSGWLSSPGQRWAKTLSATPPLPCLPFQCVLGYQPVLAPWHQSQIEAHAVDEWFRRSFTLIGKGKVSFSICFVLIVHTWFPLRYHLFPI